MISPNKTPSLKTINPTITLIITFKKALKVSPSLMRFAVSSINVEKVENAPQKPAIKKILKMGLKRNFA